MRQSHGFLQIYLYTLSRACNLIMRPIANLHLREPLTLSCAPFDTRAKRSQGLLLVPYLM